MSVPPGVGGGAPVAPAGAPVTAATVGLATPTELLTVTVVRNENGYGMKVSGDNPVYVQSVKEGGAAWRSGLRAGDRILRVNGVPVPTHTHLQVVQMIKASPNVELTVQQSAQRHKTSAITAPQPVDQEKQRQLEFTKVNTIRLMLENEQKHMEILRNELTRCSSGEKRVELEAAEQRCLKLQHQIDIITSSLPTPEMPTTNIQPPVTPKLTRAKHTNLDRGGHNNSTGFLSGLPRSLSNLTGQSLKNLRQVRQNMTNRQHENQPFLERQSSEDTSTKRIKQHNNTVPMVPVTCLDGNLAPPPLPPRTQLQKPKRGPLSPPPSHIPINPLAKPKTSPCSSASQSPRWTQKVPRVTAQYSMDVPPQAHMQKSCSSPSYRGEPNNKYRRSAHSLEAECRQENGQPNSIAMQMSYPLVAHPQPSLQMDVRTSGIPILHTRSQSSPEQLDHGRLYGEGESWERSPPPGTPPPPYPHARPDAQRAIISMEEDDSNSDNSCNSGLFSSLRSVRESKARMAVLLNWLLCENRNASANLFLLLTDGFRSATGVPLPTLQRWAYELHSTFVVPNAVLPLTGVDENMAREIDEVLINEYNKEEILRNVFRKARAKAKEQLAQQLSEFQVKRQVGLGMLYGPGDSVLEKCDKDKAQEISTVESLMSNGLRALSASASGDVWGCTAGSPVSAPLLAASAAAALVLQVRPQTVTAAVGGGTKAAYLQREKNYKQRLKQITKQAPQPLLLRGHQFSLQALTSAHDCQHCGSLIWGIAPQAYVCNGCELRVHRVCAKRVEETCCLDAEQSNNRISRFFHPASGFQESGDKKSRKTSGTTAMFLNSERSARRLEDDLHQETHPAVQGGNSGADAKREGSADDSGVGDGDTTHDASQDKEDVRDGVLWRSPGAGGKPVNRAESCREPANSAGSRRGKQRNASDPNRLTANTNTNDCEGGAGGGGGGAPSGSSSSSSLSSRSNEGAPAPDQHASQSDFSEEEDALAETWSSTVPTDVVDTLCARLRKRQELIHELITSESSHVRWLKVLYKVFYRPLERGKAGTLLTQEDIKSLFPNLPAVREKHAKLYADLRALRREPGQDIVHIAPLATAMLNTLGDATYATCLSRFCRGQRMALDALRERRRKSKELATLLSTMEQHRLCGRLQLRELCAVVWQRLTKYQLLLENVLRTVQDPETEPEEGISSEDVALLRKALDTAKDVLNRVDTAVRTAENQHRMRTIQNKLEVRGEGAGGDELRKLDLTSLTLQFEGELSMRVDSKKIMLLALLTREHLVLLQRVDDKFILKQMSQLTPLIKWSTVLFRANAAVKNTFFLMNVNGSHMYELSANTTAEYNTWKRHISEMPLATLANTRPPSVLPNRDRDDDSSGGGVSRNASDASRTSASSALEETPDGRTDADIDTDKSKVELDNPDADTDKEGDKRSDMPPSEPVNEHLDQKTSSEDCERGSTEKPTLTLHEWTPPPALATAAAEADPAPLFAQRAFSAQERLRRLDHGITRALAAKGALVGEMLGVPRDSVAEVTELAVADSLGQLDSPGAADLHQLLLAAHAQANQLTEALSKALNVSDADVIAARHMAPWRDNRGLCDTCTRKRVDSHESHVTGRVGDEASAAADQHADISSDSADVNNDNADVNTSSAAETSAESIEIVLPQGALGKEVSFDMLSELERPAAHGSTGGRVLLEEIGETSTDPFFSSTAGSDAWLAARLVPVASGLQATLSALLQAVPALQADRHALRRELAALRDHSDACRHAALSGRATVVEPSSEVVGPPSQEQHNNGG